MIYKFDAYVNERYNAVVSIGTKLTVHASKLNLRKTAEILPNNIIEKIPNGQEVTVTGELKNGFYKVSYDGKAGYAHSKYISGAGAANIKPDDSKTTIKGDTAIAAAKPNRDVIVPEPAGTPDCAAYVRKCFQKADKLVSGVVGNAWGFFKNLGGNVVFNTFDQIIASKAQQIKNIMLMITSAKKEVAVTGETIGLKYPNYKKVNAAIKALYPPQVNFDLSKVQQYDLVGMFYSLSENHVRAFDEAASRKTGIIIKDSPVEVDGKDVDINEAFTFNTHLGFISVIKNGIPYVQHNIHGKVHVTALPLIMKRDNPSNLMVAWIKRA